MRRRRRRGRFNKRKGSVVVVAGCRIVVDWIEFFVGCKHLGKEFIDTLEFLDEIMNDCLASNKINQRSSIALIK